jgi:endonuclease YncB( thermonuclease family)
MKISKWTKFANLLIAASVALLLCSSVSPGAQFKVTRVTDGDPVGIKGQGNELIFDGKNVNLEMVKAGYAEVYRGPPAPGFDNSPYWHAEEDGRAAKRGMWVQGNKNASREEWRKTHP